MIIFYGEMSQACALRQAAGVGLWAFAMSVCEMLVMPVVQLRFSIDKKQ